MNFMIFKILKEYRTGYKPVPAKYVKIHGSVHTSIIFLVFAITLYFRQVKLGDIQK